uniref:Uncharacterized protein n=1 Tax=Solanum lycopersicum TaxID=4081 RepID=A0A3Q7IGW8_SOLLC
MARPNILHVYTKRNNYEVFHMQYPNNLVRFRCCSFAINLTSLSNTGVLENGVEITGKKLDMTSRHGHSEFDSEVKLIPNLQHRNLTKMSGYCINGAEKFLVDEFMADNSLGKDPMRISILQALALYELSNYRNSLLVGTFSLLYHKMSPSHLYICDSEKDNVDNL